MLALGLAAPILDELPKLIVPTKVVADKSSDFTMANLKVKSAESLTPSQIATIAKDFAPDAKPKLFAKVGKASFGLPGKVEFSATKCIAGSGLIMIGGRPGDPDPAALYFRLSGLKPGGKYVLVLKAAGYPGNVLNYRCATASGTIQLPTYFKDGFEPQNYPIAFRTKKPSDWFRISAASNAEKSDITVLVSALEVYSL